MQRICLTVCGVLMLTRPKLKRGEGQLVKFQSNPHPRRERVPLSPP